MDILKALKKNSKSQGIDILSESTFFDHDYIPCDIPILNLAVSGSLRRGLIPGSTVFAGPSKHGKSILSNVCSKAYFKKYEDAIMLFMDSEFGTPESYFESLSIPTDRILHCPVLNVEQLKFELVKQLEFIKENYPGQKVVVYIDSIGNIASKKEAMDAQNENSAADMSRAKEIKSLTRIITPYMRMMDILMLTVAHTYKTMEMYAKDVVAGGGAVTFFADNVFVMGRQQEKDGKELKGFNLMLGVNKSRYCVEGNRFPIEMRFDGGINKWSGLLDVAMSIGWVMKPSNGWYSRVVDGVQEEKKWRKKDTNTEEFWNELFENDNFHEAVENKYHISSGKLIHEDAEPEDFDGIDDEYGEVEV